MFKTFEKIVRRINRFTIAQDQVMSSVQKLAELSCNAYWEGAMLSERNRDEKRLLKFGYRTYSQNDEDGIIAEIFRRIGCSNKTFIEFGIGDGTECNSLNLIAGGWRGLWVERNDIRAVAQLHKTLIETGILRIQQAKITAENIDQVLAENALDPEPDLLSIDVDGNDYWLWRAVSTVKPRVLVIEYNPLWRPPLSVSMRYNPNHAFRRDGYFGCSLKALEKLSSEKGYNLVGCCFAGANAFFVRQDLCGGTFREPFTAENHYEPPRYFMLDHPLVQTHGFGPLDLV